MTARCARLVERRSDEAMLDLFLEVLAFFGWVYDADRRPEARSVTLGCAAVVVVGVVGIGFLVWLLR